MRVMPELMLIEESIERTSAQVQALLTLLQLSFEAGAARARQIHHETGRIIDPVASSLYEEARLLLLLPYPRVTHATVALTLAARLEPECYAATCAAIFDLHMLGLDDTVQDELTADTDAIQGDERQASKPKLKL